MEKLDIVKALSTVKYPPYDKDIASFGMVKEVRIDGQTVVVGIYTGANDEKNAQIQREAESAILRAFPDCHPQVIMLKEDPAKKNIITPDPNVLKDVKHIVAVASGKGGVGKSTVAANLARALAKIYSTQDAAKVGLIDCDIHGPSATILFGQIPSPSTDGEKIFPPVSSGVKTISMAMLVDDSQPLIWRGPMISGAIRQFVNDVEWGKLEFMVLDLPPGTGDAIISATQMLRIDGAIIVTTANKLAEKTAARGAKLFEKTNIKILGVVENMAYLQMPDGSKMKIFGEGGAKECAEDLQSEVIAQIPIDASLQSENPSVEIQNVFDELAARISKSLECKG